jgi:hypothetical protein
LQPSEDILNHVFGSSLVIDKLHSEPDQAQIVRAKRGRQHVGTGSPDPMKPGRLLHLTSDTTQDASRLPYRRPTSHFINRTREVTPRPFHRSRTPRIVGKTAPEGGVSGRIFRRGDIVELMAIPIASGDWRCS